MSEPLTVWITKYALSSGIFTTTATVSSVSPDMIVDSNARFTTFFHDEGEEWHRTEEAAIRKADEMRHARIAMLKKKIAKLERLDFGAKP